MNFFLTRNTVIKCMFFLHIAEMGCLYSGTEITVCVDIYNKKVFSFFYCHLPPSCLKAPVYRCSAWWQ